jgi:hypothetical protein
METNVRGTLLVAVAIPLAMACAACEPTRIETVKPPVALTECADEPLAPNLPGRDLQEERDAMTLAYIFALREAWGDCKADVVALKEWSAGL